MNPSKPPSKKNVLRPAAVRERCKAIQGCKELRNKDPFSTTISFMLYPTPPAEGEESQEVLKLPIRVSVFCDTGTIATAKVIDGQVRQSFRRNVTSLDVMERLIRHPEGPVEINSQLIGITDTDDDHEDSGGSLNFKKGVELADVGLCILEGEREKLAKHLRHIDDEAEKEASELREYQAKQLFEKQQREQEALKQKQQPSKPSTQQPKQTPKQPSGEKQAQLLKKAMKGAEQKSNGGDSNRIGRRRNKLNNLRKNRNLNNSKKPQKPGLSNSGHDMNKTKRRGGKQGGATDTKQSSSDKKQMRARAAAKAASNNDSHDESSASDASMSTAESSKQVNSVLTEAFKNCGYEFHFKLPAEVMNQVDQCLRDIAKMNKVVKAVATNGRGTVFLYGNGGVAYTPAIPKALYQKLRQLRSSSFSSRPCFVALGTRDRYYVSFNDGSADWKGSSSLDKMLKKRVTKRSSAGGQADGHANDGAANLPRSVAFGATYDTFFVVFNDGSWEYQGRSIPKSLEKKLRERDDAADIVICNLGPNGEWFLKAENGKMWWSGITPELDMVLKKITKTGYLHNMDFGENGSYFVSYDEE